MVPNKKIQSKCTNWTNKDVFAPNKSIFFSLETSPQPLRSRWSNLHCLTWYWTNLLIAKLGRSHQSVAVRTLDGCGWLMACLCLDNRLKFWLNHPQLYTLLELYQHLSQCSFDSDVCWCPTCTEPLDFSMQKMLQDAHCYSCACLFAVCINQ